MLATDSEIVKLIQFDELWMTRTTPRTLGTRNQAARLDFSYAELIESYFWLALGVELGYFPERETALLARHRFTPTFRGMLELLKFKNYLVNPNLADRLVADQNHKTLLSPEAGRKFLNPGALLRAFQHALALETEVASDDSVSAFFAALAMRSTEEIRHVLSSDQTIESGFLRLTRGILMEGFAIAIQHMDSFRELDEQVSEDKAIELEDKGLFKSRIHQLVRWRMNFESERLRNSFQLVAAEFLVSMPSAFQNPGDYWRSIDGLALAWRSGGGTIAAG